MNYNLKAILESVLISMISTFFAIILFFVPILNIAVLLFPVPFIVVGARRGIWAGVLGLVVSTLLLTMIIHPLLGLIMFILNVFLLVGLLWALNKRMQMNECIIITSASILASILISFQVFGWVVGQNFFDFMWESLEQFFVTNSASITAVIEIYEKMGILDRVYSVEEFAQIFIGQLQALLPLLPSALLIFSISLGIIVFLLARAILKKFKIAVPFVPHFRNWALPRGTGRGFLTIMLIAVIGMFIGIPNFGVVLYTITALFSFIFAIQGLATADFFLKLGNLPSVVQVLILIAAFIFMSAVLTFIGIAEQIFGFRRAYTNKLRH